MASKLHVRSNSLPNGSHPWSSRVQEQLNNLRNFEATCTSESVVKGLSMLEDVYFSMDNLLNVGSTQKAISDHQSEKCFQEILDGSIKVLDVCGIARDTVMQIKENVQSLHSSLRRRKGDSCIEKSIAEYNSSSKKMRKNVNKLITSLKHLRSLTEGSLRRAAQPSTAVEERSAPNQDVSGDGGKQPAKKTGLAEHIDREKAGG